MSDMNIRIQNGNSVRLKACDKYYNGFPYEIQLIGR